MKRETMSLGKKDQHFRTWRKSISILNHVPGTFNTSCVCTGLIINFPCKLETLGSSQTTRTWDKDKWVKKNGEGTLLPKKTTNQPNHKEEAADRDQDPEEKKLRFLSFCPYECRLWTCSLTVGHHFLASPLTTFPEGGQWNRCHLPLQFGGP